MEIYIYTLSHPITKEIKYIGKTNNLKARLLNHIANSKRGKKSYVYSWIRSLMKDNLLPEIYSIETCNESNWEERECYWISYYRQSCKLCNMTQGGETGLGAPSNVDIAGKIDKIEKVIDLINQGISQTDASLKCGLYKGFLSQLRKNKIPYLKDIIFNIPESDYKNRIENLKKYSFKKGMTHINTGRKKNSGKGYYYSTQVNKWVVRGYKNSKRCIIGYASTEDEAVKIRKVYMTT